MSFNKLIDQVSKGERSIQISEEWGQGRAVFGGLVAALVYQAMVGEIEDGRPVRSLQISFVGPVSVDIPLELSSEVLRTGKSVSQILGRGIQNGQTLITISGSFGHRRDSSIEVIDDSFDPISAPDHAQKFPFIEGMTPKFTQFFDFRYCTPLPFTGSSDNSLKGFVRFNDDKQNIDNTALLGLVDAWPPTPLPKMNKVAPASSLNWTIDFVNPTPRLSAGEFSYYHADIVHAEGGYASTRAKIWNCQGELIAISQQMVTIFG